MIKYGNSFCIYILLNILRREIFFYDNNFILIFRSRNLRYRCACFITYIKILNNFVDFVNRSRYCPWCNIIYISYEEKPPFLFLYKKKKCLRIERLEKNKQLTLLRARLGFGFVRVRIFFRLIVYGALRVSVKYILYDVFRIEEETNLFFVLSIFRRSVGFKRRF